uniref:Plastid light harvesting protein n=1 Tax=Craspedostauros australis TaxID=1486917 RepID=A0A7R9WUW1_9STRA|mmetsp:Transcript_19767/g.54976  ORF Transcript_19767/g.54976 Transcript_19767/m.54976 type:complete len:198 (+) Transcript_19767:46-639(+)
MKTAAALLTLFSAASAFTSTQPSSRSVAMQAAMDEMDGSFDFRGKEFKYDPLKLSETYEPFLPWFRECELRHGRTAMLAVVGFIATDFIRIPGEMYSFEAIPKTIDAHDALLKTGPMYQLALWIGLFDLIITAPAAAAAAKGDREPGDFGWYMAMPKTDEGFAKKRQAELMNGRLAMIAVGGIATQSITTGHGFPYL